MPSSGFASRAAALASLVLLVAACGVRPNNLRSPAPASASPPPPATETPGHAPAGRPPFPAPADLDAADAGV